jgi:hypothetical protein
MAVQNIRRVVAATAAVAGLGALIVGCASQQAPMALACEPNQRALVRQVMVNGAPQAQLECQSVAGPADGRVTATMPAGYATSPVSYAEAAPIGDARLVRTAYTEPVATRVVAAPRRTVYQPRERVIVGRPKRSVQKSAVIIGSSAGVGAGIGAAIGGKKGAGIGALLGGGGAALWDQFTRRK